MRNAFARAVIALHNTPETFFLTGDLGFMALEGVRDCFAERFINCGIAEQNMVSVAAGLAREGFTCFVYSIAPFLYARPFEQIRNDLCFSALPVCLVGNGGGYGYGHMGPTHHALEDCAAMRALGVRVLVPCFNEDVPALIREVKAPTWLRLGYDTRPKDFPAPAWAAWRMVLSGARGVWVTLGPLTGLALEALRGLAENARPTLWACGEFCAPPPELLAAVAGQPLTIFEEHVAEGGLGMTMLYHLAKNGVAARQVTHRYALRYPSHTFGSQTFHRAECGLDLDAMRRLLADKDLA